MSGFVLPPYPYDRLASLLALAREYHGDPVDLSIGTPCDPPPDLVLDALAASGTERSYPPSIGSLRYRQAASDWLQRRFAAVVPVEQIAACVGTKEVVAGLPHWLRLRDGGRDTVLYPSVSYPSYAMGAELAGLRAVAVPCRDDWSLDLDAIDPADAQRALCLWVNTPGNPAGGLDDLSAVAEWGRRNGVLVVSDECYIEFTWDGPGRTVLTAGLDGVLAVHSLSKRSNLAGARAGFYAGDPDVVRFLSEVRKHAGLMVPGPVQAAAVAAFEDDHHVDVQRDVYLHRLRLVADGLANVGLPVELPRGGFYLWVPAPEADAWRLARALARTAGLVVSPGEFYGDATPGYVRIAVVQPDEALVGAVAKLKSGLVLDD